MHAAGLSLRSIAAKRGITLGQAQRLLAEAIATLPAQDVDELRTTSELRLDRAAEVFAELAASATDDRIRLQATSQLVAVERDRARLLGTWLRPEKDA
jgi:hypothetical protein